MRCWIATLTVLGLCATSSASEPEVPEGFVALFNGRDLEGWWGLGTEDPAKWQALPPEDLQRKRTASMADIQKHWRVETGVLVNDGQGLYLTTLKDYTDFELWVEYKTVAKADSGIYLRGIPQVQIWDTTEAGGKWNIGADRGSGGLWNNSPGAAGKDPQVLADRPFGEWNQFRIRMVGERVTILFNGQCVVQHARLENYFDRQRPLPRSGPIQLQTHGGEILWRNIFLREIPPEQACEILAKENAEPYSSLFNGKDFGGWQGALDDYEIRDEALSCRAGRGGTLFTQDQFGDFAVRFEFNLPPGGNNGLAIRYSGQGDPAYSGMCELQVLDNHHERYAKLDSRQYHGSAYGQVAASRGYLNPAGTWNFQEVQVRGSVITVELNGTRILHANLAGVSEFLHEASRFAERLRPVGHFGFAGHSDPVRFRNIRLKKLATD
jgi:hypothetical protein